MTTQTLDNLNFIPSALRTILRAFQGIDFWLLGATAFLIMVGLNVLHFSQHTQGYFDKQLQYMWAGLALSLAVSRIPYKLWTNKYMVSFLYLLNLALLVAVMLKGHSAQGAQRWLALGPITLQPSEVAKPIVIFSLGVLRKMQHIQTHHY